MEQLYESMYKGEQPLCNYEDIISQLQQLEKRIHKMRKKKKGAKRGKKRKLK